MSDQTRTAFLGDSPSDVRCRLIVSWRRPSTRTYHAIGLLDQTIDGTYHFTYLKSAITLERFEPLLGFSEMHRRYSSPRLFSIFSERVMDPSRPSRDQWLAELGLAPDAGPMEVLSRTAGLRQGDRLELTPMPTWSRSDRTTSAVFLAHGVRHHQGARERIATLKPGDPLQLRPDLANPVNSKALAVRDLDGHDLGWLPDPLLAYAHEVRRGGDEALDVVVANGVDVDPHLQLVVSLTGTVANDFIDPFAAAEWIPASQTSRV